MPTPPSRPDNDVTDPARENDPASGTDPAAASRRRLPTFGLSMTQLVATGLAATTATIAASFLGITGTVIGAALASVTTAVGNAVYGQSLRSGRDRVRDVVPVLARPVPRHDGTEATATASLSATATASHPRPAASSPAEPPELPAAKLIRPVVWKRAAFGAVSVFVAVLAVVTGVEVVAGRPISDVVRGSSGSGTSFFGNAQVKTKTVTPAVSPVPTTTVTVTPKITYVTPTVTQTAPTRTQTATPSTTVTTTPTPTASPAQSSDSASPSASTTSSP